MLVSPHAYLSVLNGSLTYASLSRRQTGMFTVSDIIHLIQYYYHTNTFDGAAADVEHFRLESIRGELCTPIMAVGHTLDHHLYLNPRAEVEQQLQVPQPPLLSVHPMRPLYEACRLLIRTHARRLPLIDRDEQTGKEVVLSVLTQYRVLKFMAVNVSLLRAPCRCRG